MDWINVKDKLPLDEEDYLVRFIGWDDMSFFRVLSFDQLEKQWFDYTGSERGYKTVTHWAVIEFKDK